MANTADVRKVLRRRARYERDNDPHLCGLTKTLAHDLVGTGPRLQLMVGESQHEAAAFVAASYAAWCRATDLAEKLRIMHEVRPVDGESFGQFTTNPLIPHPVKLDLRVIESEQVATPGATGLPYQDLDGIEFDQFGNPTYYHVLREHPGDSWSWGQEYDRVPAKLMVHWFRPTRPGQSRGASELAASLPIGAQTRRYANAVLTAAEYAASINAVLKTNLSTPEGAAPTYEEFDEVPFGKGVGLTLPSEWDMSQFKAEQPTGTYEQFVTSKRSEMGRPVLAPRNQVTGDSSAFNFASGRLDHLPYQRVIWIERDRLRARVLDKLFLAWVMEAQLLGLIPDSLPPVNEWVWDWHWDGFASLDPVKETDAVEKRLGLNLTTLAEECAAEGKNWREVIDQRAVELAYMRKKGVLAAPVAEQEADDPTEEEEVEDEQEAPADE